MHAYPLQMFAQVQCSILTHMLSYHAVLVFLSIENIYRHRYYLYSAIFCSVLLHLKDILSVQLATTQSSILHLALSLSLFLCLHAYISVSLFLYHFHSISLPLITLDLTHLSALLAQNSCFVPDIGTGEVMQYRHTFLQDYNTQNRITVWWSINEF